MPSWLSALSTHAIFELPAVDSSAGAAPPSTPPRPGHRNDSSSYGYTQNGSTTTTPLASSTSTSRTLFGKSTNFTTSTPNALRTSSKALANSTTLTRSSSATSSINGLAAGSSKKPEVGGLGRKNKIVDVAGRDLIVAVGNELRIANLNQVKSKVQDPSVQHDLGDYKVLGTPIIKFEIQQLVLNPTGKFLAVVGAHSIAVVVLPRKGWSSTIGTTIECRSLLVGRYYHALTGSPLVAQVIWHPWGTDSSSLLVLTVDGTVREYDISTDVEEPMQTLSFVKDHQQQTTPRSSPTKRPGGFGFSAEDGNAKLAVAMALGDGKGDWGPLTLFGLMRNGDILAICPFMPKKVSIPASYIHALSSFVSTKVDYLGLDDPDASTNGTSSALTIKSSTPNRTSSSTTSRTSHLSALYAHQLQYVQQLVRQTARASNASEEEMDLDPTFEESSRDPLIHLTAPRFGSGSLVPKVQGPFLLQPEPVVLDHEGDLESLATDLIYLHYEPEKRESSTSEAEEIKIGIGVLGIAYQDGKVDLCLAVEKIEACWNEAPVPSERRSHDDEDDDEEGLIGLDLPSLCVYETIDLGLVQELDPNRIGNALDDLQNRWVSFVKDPLYVDTIYVQHALGAHCLVLSDWVDTVLEALNPNSESIAAATQDDEEKLGKEMDKAIRSSESTRVVWIVKTLDPSDTNSPPVPIEGVDLINDVYLGYSMLLVTSSLQLVAIELSLRVDSSLLPSTTLSASTLSTRGAGLSSEPPPYLSLLEAPFEIPSILSSPQHVLPRQVIPKNLANKGTLEVVTPESLRFVGKSVELLRTNLAELVQASDSVQNRIELQLAELARQLKKVQDLRGIIKGGLIHGLDREDDDYGDELRGKGREAEEENLYARIELAKKKQEELLKRTDKVLQTLMNRHAPLISTFERKWLDELDRLAIEIKGKKENDDRGRLVNGAGVEGGGLEMRVERLREKVETLRPGLEEMKRKEQDTQLANGGGSRTYISGTQLEKVEEKLSDEANLIAEARRKVERLSHALGSISIA